MEKFLHIVTKSGMQAAAQLVFVLVLMAYGLVSVKKVLGHACSAVTMMNLVRLGNNKVLEKYNCIELLKQ